MTDAKALAAAKKAAAAQPPKSKPTKAVAEILAQPREVTIRGIDLTIPAQLPFAVMRYAGDENGAKAMIGILEAVLGKDQMQRVWDAGFSMQEGSDFTAELMAEYDVSSGESSASSGS